MTDQTGASAGGEAFNSVPLPADAPEAFNSPREAAEYFTGLLEKPKKEQTAESADPATADNELAQANAGPDENPAPGEEPEGNDPEAEKLPPIERPRSWSKDDDDDWNALPRARQEKIATNERAREADINRRINDAAEKLKGLTAKEQQAEQARQAFETQARAAEQVILREQQRDFPDIKTLDDVRNLAAADPFRYLQWDAHQKDLAAIHSVTQDADRRSASERQSSWTNFVQKESAAFAESVPEYKAKKADYDTKAAVTLREMGFTDDELNKLASGEEKIPLFDRRIQRLLFDHIKLSEIRSAPKAVVKPDLPPVQRPGTSKPAGSVVSEKLQALETKFNRTGSLKDAQALYAAQIEVQSRRRAS